MRRIIILLIATFNSLTSQTQDQLISFINGQISTKHEQPIRTITIPYDLIGILEYIINNKLNLRDVHQLLNNNAASFDGIDGKFSFRKNIISRELNILKILNGKADLVE